MLQAGKHARTAACAARHSREASACTQQQRSGKLPVPASLQRRLLAAWVSSPTGTMISTVVPSRDL